MVQISTPKRSTMKENGMPTREVGGAVYITLMALCTKGSGIMTNAVGKGS